MEVIAEGAVFMDGMDGSACHWLPTRENDKPGDTAMTERRHLEQVGVFNGGVDWDDKSEPINLPLGYTRGTYKTELARRARIYANWGKTT